MEVDGEAPVEAKSSKGAAHADHAHSGGRPLYQAFLGQVMALSDGSLDSTRFEEWCRANLGNHSYPLFTLDKLLQQLVKHLQAMANDDNVMKLIGLFVYHHQHRTTVNVSLYRAHAAQILSYTTEDCFRFQLLCAGEGIMSECSELGIQPLGILTVPTGAAASAASASAASAAPVTEEGISVASPSAVHSSSTAMDVDDTDSQQQAQQAAQAEAVMRIERAGSLEDMILSPTSAATHAARQQASSVPLPSATQRALSQSRGRKVAVESDSEDEDDDNHPTADTHEGGGGGGGEG